MAAENWASPVHALREGQNVVGGGVARPGRWEARAMVTPPYPGDRPGLFVWLELWSEHGNPAGGSGCGPARLADAENPVEITMSGQKPPHWFYYLGQAIPSCTAVDLRFADGSIVRASILEPDLPLKLWVAFTDRSSQLRAIQGSDGKDGFPEVAVDERPPDHPGSRSASWGRPLYEEEDELL